MAVAKDKHWFHSKTPAQKKAYIAKHPNSVYAKSAGAGPKDDPKAAARAYGQAQKAFDKARDAEDAHAQTEEACRKKGGTALKRYEEKYHALRKVLKQKALALHGVHSKHRKSASRTHNAHYIKASKHLAYIGITFDEKKPRTTKKLKTEVSEANKAARMVSKGKRKARTAAS